MRCQAWCLSQEIRAWQFELGDLSRYFAMKIRSSLHAFISAIKQTIKRKQTLDSLYVPTDAKKEDKANGTESYIVTKCSPDVC